MLEPTQNIESTEPSTIVEEASNIVEEVRVLPIPIGKGASKSVEAAGVKPIVIIFQEILLAMPKSFVPSPENVL